MPLGAFLGRNYRRNGIAFSSHTGRAGGLLKIFNYSIAKIKIAFNTALDFSLIRAIDFRDDDFDDKLARPKKNILYSTTLKGQFVLKMAFEDYAVFYLMAIATPLDLSINGLKSADNKLLIHSDNVGHNDQDRHFYRSAILLGMILWIHIHTTERQERLNLKPSMDVNSTEGITVSNSVFEMSAIINKLPKLAAELLIRINGKQELKVIKDVLDKLTIT